MTKRTLTAAFYGIGFAGLLAAALAAGSPVSTYQRPPNAISTRPATGSVVKDGLLPAIKPLLDVQMRDPSICLGGDGNYYLTGSTGMDIWDHNDGIELWRSPDLKKWDYLGLVWSIERDGTWEKQWRDLHGKPARAVWAPEIHYLHGNYFIPFSMASGGIGLLKSATGKPEGPYVNALKEDKPLMGGIDPTLFQDDDGKVYFTFLGASWIARMKDDMSGLAEGFHQIQLLDPDHDPAHHAGKCAGRGTNDIGNEGATLFKAHGKYYLGAADTYQGRYSSVVAIADTIYGPYHGRHEAIPCGGHNAYFQDKQGHWWGMLFGNDSQAPWRERPAIVPIDFGPDGKIKVIIR